MASEVSSFAAASTAFGRIDVVRARSMVSSMRSSCRSPKRVSSQSRIAVMVLVSGSKRKFPLR